MFGLFKSDDRQKRELIASLRRRLATAMKTQGVNSAESLRISVHLDQLLSS